jgi:hypothetical protein
MSLQEMVVRLRFPNAATVKPSVSSPGAAGRGPAALAFAALLTPAVITALALGFWKLAADLGAAGQFAIQTGLFSHWQVWFAVAALVQFSVSVLNRMGSATQRAEAIRNSEDSSSEDILNSELSPSKRR